MSVDWTDRQRRVDVANEFIRVIAAHGRRFFHHEGRVSRFELDCSGRLWWVDKWRGSRLYCHQAGWWGRKFSEGGTMQVLALALRDYIMARAELPLGHLGPWPAFVGGDNGPDLWGYGGDMVKVRILCRALAEGAPK